MQKTPVPTQAVVSELAFANAATRKVSPTLAHARVFATSKTYSWDGIYAEVGENQGWHVENMVPVGHYIAISRRADDFRFKVIRDGQWHDVVMPPRSLWIQPANQAFSFHVEELSQWCGVVVQPAKLKALVGSESAIEAVIGLEDDVLTAIMEAICAEVLRGGNSGRKFAEAMTVAIGTQLLRLFGEANAAPKGGITGRQLRLISDYVDAQLEREISVAKLAELAGLSEAHFARAFKQSTALSPHKFVIERRLERAKRLLADTEDSIADVALACGFSDQAHFSRTFAQAYGATPSALRKSFTSG
jgi:AraC family transcriptional regulator